MVPAGKALFTSLARCRVSVQDPHTSSAQPEARGLSVHDHVGSKGSEAGLAPLSGSQEVPQSSYRDIPKDHRSACPDASLPRDEGLPSSNT